MEEFVLQRIPSMQRTRSRDARQRDRGNITDIGLLPADVRLHVLMQCDFEHKVMFLNTSKDMNALGEMDVQWQQQYMSTQERYEAAKRVRDQEMQNEERFYMLGLCAVLAVALLSGLFNGGVGYFLWKTGTEYADAHCNYPIAWALRCYGLMLAGSWVINMAKLAVAYTPIATRFYPRSWSSGAATTTHQRGEWFDLEAGAPLLEPGEGGFLDEDKNRELVEDLQNPTGMRAGLFLLVQILTGVIQAFGLYLFVLLNIYVWSSSELLCDPWLYTVAWWLIMLPWIIIACTCSCVCVCACCIAMR